MPQDDPYSRLQQFFQRTLLKPEDQTEAENLLADLVGRLTGQPIAQDRIAPRPIIVRGTGQRPKGDHGFSQRFPYAASIRRL